MQSTLLMSGVIMAMSLCPLQGVGALNLDTEIVASRYCAEPSGLITLRLQLRLKYRNTGEAYVLIPRLTQMLEQRVYSVGDRNQPGRDEAGLVFAKESMFEEGMLDESRPQPVYFISLAPSAEYKERTQQVIILLNSPRQRVEPLLGKDHLLTFELDHWTSSREYGERLRQRWQPYGLLWIDPIWSSPVKISVDESPKAERCPAPAVSVQPATEEKGK